MAKDPSRVTSWLRTAGASVIAAAVACGGGGRPATSTPTVATPTSSPAPAPRTFESERHGYAVAIPPFWNVVEYEGRWTRLEQFHPGAEVPGEDVISSADGQSFLVANSMLIPPGTSAAEWQTSFDALVEAGLDRACDSDTKTGTFAGEPATIVEQRCGGSKIVGRSLTHEGRGYYFTTRFDIDAEAAGALLDALARSTRFIGA